MTIWAIGCRIQTEAAKVQKRCSTEPRRMRETSYKHAEPSLSARLQHGIIHELQPKDLAEWSVYGQPVGAIY